MAKVRVRKESNKLFIDFRYQGRRFREQTHLDNTPQNRKKLELLLQRMEAKMLLDDFSYEEFFPGSANIRKFSRLFDVNSGASDLDESISSTPSDLLPTF